MSDTAFADRPEDELARHTQIGIFDCKEGKQPGSTAWVIGDVFVSGKHIVIQCADKVRLTGKAGRYGREGSYYFQMHAHFIQFTCELTRGMIVSFRSSLGDPEHLKSAGMPLEYDKATRRFALGGKRLKDGDRVVVQTVDGEVLNAFVCVQSMKVGPEYHELFYGQLTLRVPFYRGNANHIMRPLNPGRRLAFAKLAETTDAD